MRESSPEPRVLLLTMPWAHPGHPQLALGLLKAALSRDGIACDVHYANLDALHGLDDWDAYQYLSLSLEGDLVFTPHAFGVDPDETAAKIVARATENGYAHLADAARARALIDAAGSFLDHVAEAIDWTAYDVVGFTLVFQQLCSSLALAQRVRERHPDVRIVFGGPTCEDEMGEEIVRAFDVVDYAVQGEADLTVAELVREIVARPRGDDEPLRTPGVVWRDRAGAVHVSGPPRLVTDMDALPVPEFDEYFEQLRPEDTRLFVPFLYMECSRGCWWGEKTICTFCGLNGTSIGYRAKSPDRALTEIRQLADRHPVSLFFMTDNILDHKAYRDFLPRLKAMREEDGYDLSFFWEIKSNVSKRQVRLLHDAGVRWLQPGLESFSDHVLELMDKGTTGIQQVQLLKFLGELSMRADWNVLYGNPGERPEDYDEMAEMVPFMHHIAPPAEYSVIKMAVQRFNRYHKDPDAYGITALRPAPFYRDIVPRDDVRHERLAFHFEYEHPQDEDAELAAAHRRFFDAVAEWRRVYRPRSLTYERVRDGVRIVDKRVPPGAEAHDGYETVITLKGLQAEIYLAADSHVPEAKLLRTFADRASADAIRRFVDLLVARRLMFRSRAGKVLSMALEAAPTAPAPAAASAELASSPG